MAAEKHASLLANPVAVQLGLDEPNGPSVILSQAAEAIGAASPGETPNVLYMYLLDACEKVFENELDQATFEEHMRWFFGTQVRMLLNSTSHGSAVEIETIFFFESGLSRIHFRQSDYRYYQAGGFNLHVTRRLIYFCCVSYVLRQVQTVMVDHKCQDLLHLLQTMRSADIVTAHDAIRYRREAEQHVGSDDNLYRIDWVRIPFDDLLAAGYSYNCLKLQDKSTSILKFQLVGVDDPSIEEDNSERGRWREYIATYVMCHPTERTPATREDKISRPFLRRWVQLMLMMQQRDLISYNRTLVDAGHDTIVAQNEMQVRISLGSYKIFYEGGKEDMLWCRRSREEYTQLQARASAREEERKRTLWLSH